MNTFKFFLVSSALLFGSLARAQLVPVADITLAYPSISSVNISLGGTNRSGLPTPFIIAPGSTPVDSLMWFCLDPLQTIYTNGSLPPGSVLDYDTSNPTAFNKWNPSAPGLSAARRQNLADLFTAYVPVLNNQLLGGALQIAIWEVVNEFNGNGFNLTNGQMRVSGGAEDAAVIQAAQNMLSSLGNVGVAGMGNTLYLSYFIDGTYTNNNCDVVLVQDLLGWSPPGLTPPIPEPSTYGIAAVGLLLPLLLRRLRNRKSKTAHVEV